MIKPSTLANERTHQSNWTKAYDSDYQLTISVQVFQVRMPKCIPDCMQASRQDIRQEKKRFVGESHIIDFDQGSASFRHPDILSLRSWKVWRTE